MKFRTEITIKPQPDFISYKTEMLALGSCFADEIGNRLRDLKFTISVNPSGIVFNPVSLADLLRQSLDEVIDHQVFVTRDQLWFHYGFHSRVYGNSQTELIQKIQRIQQEIKNKIKNADLLLLTLGTSWAYRHESTGQIVANCHKIPQHQFVKELLNLEQLKEIYSVLFTRLFAVNPKLRIMLTVSPVRHSKDGLHENNLSKSILLLLTDFLVKRFESVTYFPAYEMVVDDLRDYRFYKEDLIHPSPQAVDYVFDKLSEAFFTENTKQGVEIQRDIDRLQKHSILVEEVAKRHDVGGQIKKLSEEFNRVVSF